MGARWTAAVWGAVATVSIAAGVAHAGAATRLPALSGAELLAAGVALIEGSGAPKELSLVGDHHMVRIKHDASGLICTFPGRGDNKIVIVKGNDGATTVDCIMRGDGVDETWHIASNRTTADYSGEFDAWTQVLLASATGAKPLKGKQGVEALGAVDALAKTVTATKRSGWISTGAKTVAYYGVADAGPWRITYLSTGKADAVKFLAPMVWLSGLGQVTAFKPVAFEL